MKERDPPATSLFVIIVKLQETLNEQAREITGLSELARAPTKHLTEQQAKWQDKHVVPDYDQNITSKCTKRWTKQQGKLPQKALELFNENSIYDTQIVAFPRTW